MKHILCLIPSRRGRRIGLFAGLALCALSAAGTRTVTISGLATDAQGVPSGLSLAFGEAGANETNILFMVWGETDAGTDFADWPNRAYQSTVAPETTAQTCPFPSAWPATAKAVRFFLAPKSAALPYDELLDCVAGTGLQETAGPALLLDFTPTGKTRITTAFTPCAASGKNQALFCARGASGLQDRTFTCFLIGSALRFDYNALGATHDLAEQRHELTCDYHGLTLDGTCSPDSYGTLKSFTAGGKLLLFGSYSDGSGKPNGNYGRWQLAAFKVWTDADDASTLAFDLIPVSSEGRAGLYDTVSKQLFFANRGTGDFTAGTVTNAPGVVSAVHTEVYTCPAAAAATWTGGAGTAVLATDANWKDGTAPDRTLGTARATFTEGTSTATLPSGITYFSGIVLTNGFTFAAADGARLALGADGLAVADATSATSYVLQAPLSLAAAQAWYLGTNTVVDLQQPLAATAPLTVRGRGTLNLRRPGTGSEVVTVLGCADADSSQRGGAALHVYAYTNDVFGSAQAYLDTYHTELQFVGDFTQTADILTRCDRNDWDYNLHFKGNLVFNGKYEHKGANMRPVFYRGRTVIFNNTFTTSSSMGCQLWSTFSSTAMGEAIFNKKLHVQDRFSIPAGLRITLNVATNRINGNKGNQAGILRCGCERAIEYQNGSNGGTYIYPQGNFTLDLGGYDQGVGCIYALANAGFVTSEKPATLHLVDNYRIPDYDSGQTDAAGKKIYAPGYTNYVQFTGCASFSKEGIYTNRLKRVSSTYGDLTVLKSRLEFAPEASWLNASNLTVKGTGLFTLDNRTAAQGQPFGKQLEVWVEPNWKDATAQTGAQATLELNNSLPMCVRYLNVDGKRQRCGYWGSAAAAAANPALKVNQAGFFTGTGLLLARGEPGMLFFVR